MSKLTVEKARKMLSESVRHRRGWRQDARADFEYVAGHQWDTDDVVRLDQELRPHVTYNVIGPIIDAIVGHEVANRQDIQYIPRQTGEAGVNEVLSAAAQWVRDESDSEYEESAAFYDATVSGEGWTDTEINYDVDLDGRIDIEHVDPLEIDIDPLCSKKNFANARWICRTKIYGREEALERWPDGVFEEGVGSSRSPDTPIDVIAAAFYRSDSGAEGRDASEAREVLVHDFQWYEMEAIYRVPLKAINPMQGFILMHGYAMEAAKQKPGETPLVDPDQLKPDANGLLLFDSSTWNKVKGVLEGIEPLKQKRRCYYRLYFSGDEELERSETPTGDCFSYKAITAKHDRKGHCWYGVVRGMKDPQKWANKFMSSSLEQIAASAKGGIMFETGAFVDPRAAEQDWANPSRNIEMNEGFLSRQAVQPRPVNQPPPQSFQLMAYTAQQINSTAGVNQEIMGLSQAMDPSGAMEEGRRQAALDMLAYLFDALRRYRKEQGRLLLSMIKKFIPAGRLVKITGPAGMQYVPLVYDSMTREYDVIVDEAPTSPNIKQQTWKNLMLLAERVPALMTPQMALIALDYSPFPQAMVEKMKQMSQKGLSQPNPQAQLDQVKGQEIAASAHLKQAQAQHLMQEGQQDAQAVGIKLKADEARAQAEMMASHEALRTAQVKTQGESMRAQAQASAAADKARTDIILGGHKIAQEMHKTVQSAIKTHQTLMRPR